MRLTNAKKNKEREKKEMEATNRKHLANMRVVQKNLVYVVGLSPKLAREEFIPTLKGPDYFGQYGRVAKILISKRMTSHKYGHGSHDPSMGVYVTYQSKEDAARAIVAIDGSKEPGGRIIRASYGTTKYCTSYLRNMPCSNAGCTYLHEPGEEADSFTKEDLATLRHAARDTEHKIKPASMHLMPITKKASTEAVGQAPLASSAASDEGSALPRTASWANAGRLFSAAGESAAMPSPRDPQAFPGLAAAAAASTHSPKLRPKDAKAPAPTRARETDSVPNSPTPRKAAPVVLDDVRRHDMAEPPYLFSTFDWSLSTNWGDGDFSFHLPSLPTSTSSSDDHDAAPYSGTFNPFDEPDSMWGPYEQRVPDATWQLRQQAALHRSMAPHMLDNVRAPEEQRSAAAAMLAARARQLQEAGETVSTHSMSDVRTHLARQQAQQQAQQGPTADAHSLLTLLRRVQEPETPADSTAAATPPTPLPPPGLRTQPPPNRATGLLLAQLLGTPPAKQHHDAYAAGVPPTTVRQP